MKDQFKRILYQHYYDTSADISKIKAEKEYETVIAAGTAAHLGEDYFIFIYTVPPDMTAPTQTKAAASEITRPDQCDALVILYHSAESNEPLGIHFNNPPERFEHRDKLVRSAVYFLRNQLENTLSPNPFTLPPNERPKTLRAACDYAENVSRQHRKNVKSLASKVSEFKKQGFSKNVEVTIEELNAPKAGPLPESLLIRLNALKENQTSVETGKQRRKAAARLGVCLEIRDIKDKTAFTIHPVVVPVLKNGGNGKPRKATLSLLGLYDILPDSVPKALQEYMTHFTAVSAEKIYDALKIKLLNRIFFKRVICDLNKLSGDLMFYMQIPDRSGQEERKYKRLKKILFQQAALRFMPSVQDDESFRLYLELTDKDGRSFKTEQGFRVFKGTYLFFKNTNDVGYLALPAEPGKWKQLLTFMAQGRRFPLEHYRALLKHFTNLQLENLTVIKEPLKKYRLHFYPVPCLKIIENNAYTSTPDRLKLEFDYNAPARQFRNENPGMEPLVYAGPDDPNNREFETICRRMLEEDPLLTFSGKEPPPDQNCYFNFDNDDPLLWLTSAGAAYLEKGFKLFSNRWNRPVAKVGSGVSISVDHGLRWLEFTVVLTDPKTGETFSIDEVDLKQGVVVDGNGLLHLVTAKELEKLARLYHYAEKQGDIFRIPSENYMLINQLYDSRMDNIPELRARYLTAKKLENLEEIPDYLVASEFQGRLRKYQHIGYRWLRFLHQHNFSGCLADDMGLGKTVQTLALLQSLKSEHQLAPSLLVVPVSAVSNWESEIKRFTPHLTYHLHVGVKRNKDPQLFRNIDLLITSYATLRQDIEMFKEQELDYVILDESQNIKNASSQVSKSAKLLNCNHRLALSGTPVENNSMELWSLFDFLMPGFLGPGQWFNNQFSVPIEKEENHERARVLKQMVYPFILRRKKEEVETDVPAKVEILDQVRMNEEQTVLYRDLARMYRKEVEQEIDGRGVAGSAMKVMEAMLRLRQVCLFPQLVNADYQSVPSAKFDHFLELMEDIVSEGHKVLIFSQFVKVLSVIREHFDKEEVPYSYLDGSTPLKQRAQQIASFQDDEKVRAFLLSIKAGGTAINLTAADYVIIFDPWWNPAVEAQAVDRSHRIGQKRNVMVYRLVTVGTIEEKIQKLQQKKLQLVEQLISTDRDGLKFKNLSRMEVLDLFSLPSG